MSLIKILSNSSITNKTLRKRTDVSPLIKTALQRWHYDGADVFFEWIKMLTITERKQVREQLDIDVSYWNKNFPNCPSGIPEQDQLFSEIIQQIRESPFPMETYKIEKLKEKFTVKRKVNK